MIQFPFAELKNNLPKIVGLSYISPEDLQHKIHGHETIQDYRELMIEESRTDGY